MASRVSSSGTSKIDVSLARIGADELGAYSIADIEPLRALRQQPFHMGLETADERAMIGDSSDDRIEDLANARLHRDSRETL